MNRSGILPCLLLLLQKSIVSHSRDRAQKIMTKFVSRRVGTYKVFVIEEPRLQGPHDGVFGQRSIEVNQVLHFGQFRRLSCLFSGRG